MRKCFTVLAVLVALWVSFPSQAQSEVRLSSGSVDIWPEYDQPAVLVIYHISLSPDTTLPATLNLRVPAQAEVFAVAIADPAKGLLNAPYDRTVQGSWATLKITTNARDVQVEYYDTLVKNGTARHIVYEWAGDYPVDSFAVALQQPVGATDMVTDPALSKSSVGQDGFVYYQSAPQVLAAGQSFTLTADYQKATDALSTTGLPVQPTQPLNASTPGRVTMTGVLPWVLAGILGALIVVGIVGGLYMWKNGTRRSSASRKRHQQPQQASETGEIYCHQCGKRAQPGDVFCRTCGVRLQKDD
ncbi:MAG TPA: zinc ribbon domain-containing protein [Anaerolineales bacterium]